MHLRLFEIFLRPSRVKGERGPDVELSMPCIVGRMAGARRRLLELAVMVLFSVVGGGSLGPSASSDHQSTSTATKFDTRHSTLWRGSEELRFRTKYQSGTTLEGFICSDYIQVGGFGSLAPFGCITRVEGVIDGQGIAGFAPSGTGDRKGFKLPPVFKALSNFSGDHGKLGIPVPHPSFSFLCDEHGGELQLGGYDADAVIMDPENVASLSQSSYVVPISGMWIGKHPVLKLAGSAEEGSVRGILDSGATCMCLPNNTMGGKLVTSPWQALMSAAQDSPSRPLTVEINGTIKIDIPAEVWAKSVESVKSCPSSTCPNGDVVLGDWFFRAALVKIDWLPDGQNPGISIGYRNYSYVLKKASRSSRSLTSLPLRKQYPSHPPETRHARVHQGLKRLGMTDPDRVALLIPVDIGWPPQRFNLVFDTGSSFFGVMTVPTHRVLLGKAEASHEAALTRMHRLHASIAPAVEIKQGADEKSEFDSTASMFALSVAMVTSVAVSVWVRRRRRRLN